LQHLPIGSVGTATGRRHMRGHHTRGGHTAVSVAAGIGLLWVIRRSHHMRGRVHHGLSVRHRRVHVVRLREVVTALRHGNGASLSLCPLRGSSRIGLVATGTGIGINIGESSSDRRVLLPCGAGVDLTAGGR
jgi:hypothetical protein